MATSVLGVLLKSPTSYEPAPGLRVGGLVEMSTSLLSDTPSLTHSLVGGETTAVEESVCVDTAKPAAGGRVKKGGRGLRKREQAIGESSAQDAVMDVGDGQGDGLLPTVAEEETGTEPALVEKQALSKGAADKQAKVGEPEPVLETDCKGVLDFAEAGGVQGGAEGVKGVEGDAEDMELVESDADGMDRDTAIAGSIAIGEGGAAGAGDADNAPGALADGHDAGVPLTVRFYEYTWAWQLRGVYTHAFNAPRISSDLSISYSI